MTLLGWVQALSSQTVQCLHEGWELARFEPDTALTPDDLKRVNGDGWRAAVVPGTVAQTQGGQGADIDAYDYWYRCRFRAQQSGPWARTLLCFDGLATLADVWLNGKRILQSESMFEAHALTVDALLNPENELCIRFRALLPVLRTPGSRGRWPTRLVSEKGLRRVRTTVLGYMPGRFPMLRPVGPWRSVRLTRQAHLAVEDARVQARLAGTRGVLSVSVQCLTFDGALPSSAEVCLGNGDARAPLQCARENERVALRGEISIDSVRPWWPHTHGAPETYPARVELTLQGERIVIELGNVGFRAIEVLRGDGSDFALCVNGERIFCRGACWVPLDLAGLHVSEDCYRHMLLQVREAGMNMLRVGGTMVYESEHFHRLCDELGILVWQDFMFASMDYPIEDPAFVAHATREAQQLMQRVSASPSLAVLCGNSEVSQQAAMMGMSSELWSNDFFDRSLPELCAQWRPDVAYVTSSPSGGTLPFHASGGPTHYFGVGVYLRPPEDVRIARVRFATECLAFANAPEDSALRTLFAGTELDLDDARYRESIVHEPGAEYDFAHVTEHYAQRLFGVDLAHLRSADPQRYLALCRVASCELMERTQGIWRRVGSGCSGALVWLLRDSMLGGGWGVIDSQNLPKSPYYGLKRACSPLCLWFVDEGLDGVVLVAANDRQAPVQGRLLLTLHREDGKIIERASCEIVLGAFEQQCHNVESLLGHFVDASYAYRFGSSQHTLVAARLVSQTQVSQTQAAEETLVQAVYLPLGLAHAPGPDLGLSARATATPDGSYDVHVVAERFAMSVAVEAPGYRPSDSYFHLIPNAPHRFRLHPLTGAVALRACLKPLNAASATPIEIV